MVNAKSELVKTWLTKARNDLGSAKCLSRGSESFFDTAIFHCQQAAEKALKAFLIHANVAFEKIHNLNVLIELCVERDLEFNRFFEAAATLTPYATAYRYPNEFFESEPEEGQLEEALRLSEEILNFVVHRIPEDVVPSDQNETELPQKTNSTSSDEKF